MWKELSFKKYSFTFQTINGRGPIFIRGQADLVAKTPVPGVTDGQQPQPGPSGTMSQGAARLPESDTETDRFG